MKEQLIKYVELLFAGNSDAEDMKQEILQNTLDKYDDYIAQGKSAEAAYRLAISGIGDISEILGGSTEGVSSPATTAPATDYRGRPVTPLWKKILRAFAVFLFIVSLIPLIVLSEVGSATVGFVGTIAIVAVGVLLLIIAGGNDHTEKEEEKHEDNSPDGQLKKAIGSAITVVGLIVYFGISFESGAWHITWLIFPIMGSVQGLINAILDLKGGTQE